MKKFLSYILWVFVSAFILSWAIFADDLLSMLEDIQSDATAFNWYTSSKKISVEALWTNYVTIKSPIITDGFGDEISKYTIIYCTTNFDNVLNDTNLLNSCNEQVFTKSNSDPEVTMRITNLDPNSIYYAVAVPTDDDWWLWEISNQVCFKLNWQISWNGNECSISDSHNSSSAWANICLANVTHICESSWCPKWTKVSLKWISSCSDRMDVLVYDRDTNNFNRLTTIDMTAESYTFNIPRKWENIIRFQPVNWWAYKDYNFQALEATTPTPTPTTVKPVVVWPKENIIAVVIWAAVLYLVYRVIKRKSTD